MAILDTFVDRLCFFYLIDNISLYGPSQAFLADLLSDLVSFGEHFDTKFHKIVTSFGWYKVELGNSNNSSDCHVDPHKQVQ